LKWCCWIFKRSSSCTKIIDA